MVQSLTYPDTYNVRYIWIYTRDYFSNIDRDISIPVYATTYIHDFNHVSYAFKAIDKNIDFRLKSQCKICCH